MAALFVGRFGRTVKHFATRGNTRCLSYVPIDDALYGLNHDQSEVCPAILAKHCVCLCVCVCVCVCVHVWVRCV